VQHSSPQSQETSIGHKSRLARTPLKTKTNPRTCALAAALSVLLSLQKMSPPASAPSTPSALTPLQAQAVIALAQGATIAATAAAAGRHRCTIHRWLNTNPEFVEAIRQTRSDILLAMHNRLKEPGGALETLRSILTDAQTSPAKRVRAALAFLERPQFTGLERKALLHQAAFDRPCPSPGSSAAAAGPRKSDGM
jgi:hypothetical protein